MIALKIPQNNFRKLDVFRSPLRFWKQYPIQRTLRALLECQRKKRLRVPHKSDIGGC